MEERKDFSKTEYRFSYILSVNDLESENDIIICKRDFNINNFDENSLRSLELKEAIDDIVRLIDRDLKSKSRVYTWCNMPLKIERRANGTAKMGVYYGNDKESSDISTEFIDPILEGKTNFKFTFYDGSKSIITKIWDGDAYPFSIRNSVDLTNKKFKYESINIQALDFNKSVAQRAAADRPDLTSIIMKHLSSVCSSFYSREHDKRVIYKQYLPELILDEIIFTDFENGKYNYVENKINSICKSKDENRGVERMVYEAYTKKCDVGGGIVYDNTTPTEDWEDDIIVKSMSELLIKK